MRISRSTKLKEFLQIRFLYDYIKLKDFLGLGEGVFSVYVDLETMVINEKHKKMLNWYKKNPDESREFQKRFVELGYLTLSDDDYQRFLRDEVRFMEFGDLMKETISDDLFAGCSAPVRIFGSLYYVPRDLRKKIQSEKRAWKVYQECRRENGD